MPSGSADGAEPTTETSTCLQQVRSCFCQLIHADIGCILISTDDKFGLLSPPRDFASSHSFVYLFLYLSLSLGIVSMQHLQLISHLHYPIFLVLHLFIFSHAMSNVYPAHVSGPIDEMVFLIALLKGELWLYCSAVCHFPFVSFPVLTFLGFLFLVYHRFFFFSFLFRLVLSYKSSVV